MPSKENTSQLKIATASAFCRALILIDEKNEAKKPILANVSACSDQASITDAEKMTI
jgi:hypothetical protein